jgi:hypothetical protein
MKAKTTARMILACLAILAASPASAIDFIRHIKGVGDSHVVIDMPLDSMKGEILSQPLDTEISIFQLYGAYKKENGTTDISKLDEKSVGSFLPQVSIRVFSEDPHVPVTTRADRPYGVSVEIKGLMEAVGTPDYAKVVRVVRGYKRYSPLTYSATGESGIYQGTHLFTSNGTHTESSVYQQLPDGVPTQAMGAEFFSAFLLPEADPAQAELARAEVIVLPAANVAINGLANGMTYKTLPNNTSITLLNAYPRSTVYAQIYKGEARLGTVGEVIPGTGRTFTTRPGDPNVPQHASIALSFEDIVDTIREDGTYTIEVMTVTPFQGGVPERLAHVSFVLDRTIELNGMVTTIE